MPSTRLRRFAAWTESWLRTAAGISLRDAGLGRPCGGRVWRSSPSTPPGVVATAGGRGRGRLVGRGRLLGWRAGRCPPSAGLVHAILKAQCLFLLEVFHNLLVSP